MLFSLGWQVACLDKKTVLGPWCVTAVQRYCVMETNNLGGTVFFFLRSGSNSTFYHTSFHDKRSFIFEETDKLKTLQEQKIIKRINKLKTKWQGDKLRLVTEMNKNTEIQAGWTETG